MPDAWSKVPKNARDHVYHVLLEQASRVRARGAATRFTSEVQSAAMQALVSENPEDMGALGGAAALQMFSASQSMVSPDDLLADAMDLAIAALEQLTGPEPTDG